MNRRFTLASYAAALALTLAVAGCTSDATKAKASSSSSAKAAATSTSQGAGLPSGVSPADIPTEVPNDPDQRKNVTLSGCAAVGGGWGASGEATNPGDAEVTYQIQIFFTTAAATTVDSAATEVTVAPGGTEKWTAEKQFGTADKMLCVLRGVALKA